MILNTSKIVFIADEFANNSSLLQNLGDEHKLGGAEQDDMAMLGYLEEEVGLIERRRSRDITADSLDQDTKYLIGNFIELSEECKDWLGKNGRYSIYEHDHKYCTSRNPAIYPGMIVPRTHRINHYFYKRAAAVFCMTKYHKSIVDKNVRCNTLPLNGSFWTVEELEFIRELSKNKKNCKTVIYGNPSSHKGMKESIIYCIKNGLDYETLPNQPTRREFLSKLSEYSQLVFLPGSPETCSRLIVEARMLGLLVWTNSIVGAAHEPWFLKNMRGQELVDHFTTVEMPIAISEIILGMGVFCIS